MQKLATIDGAPHRKLVPYSAQAAHPGRAYINAILKEKKDRRLTRSSTSTPTPRTPGSSMGALITSGINGGSSYLHKRGDLGVDRA